MTEAKELATGIIYRILYRTAHHVSDRDKIVPVVVYAPIHYLDRVLVRNESEFKHKFEML